jgi:hypothetical protein
VSNGTTTLQHSNDRLIGHDPDAWEEVYRDAYPRLHGTAAHRLGDEWAADDVVSEAMARAVRQVDTFRWADHGVDAWLNDLLDDVLRETVGDGGPVEARRGDDIVVLTGCFESPSRFMRLVPPEERVQRLRSTVRLERDGHAEVALVAADPGRRRPWRRGRALVAVALAGAIFAAGWWAAPSGGGESSEGDLLFRGRGFAGEGAAQVLVQIFGRDGGRTVSVTGRQLPTLPAGQFYELWFTRPGTSGNEVISVGTFRSAADGAPRARFDVALDPIAFDAMVLTVEPEDGDPRPGTPVLRVELPN